MLEMQNNNENSRNRKIDSNYYVMDVVTEGNGMEMDGFSCSK